MNWNTRWGRRAYKVISAWVWNRGLYTGGEATVGFGWQDRNVKKSHAYTPVPRILRMSLFWKRIRQLFKSYYYNYFLYPFNMMDTRLGGCWSLLDDVEYLHFLVKRVRMLKIGILGAFQGKMEVLQVPRERKNSHFSCTANLVQEQSKNVIKVMSV